jgi:hypothetical protein
VLGGLNELTSYWSWMVNLYLSCVQLSNPFLDDSFNNRNLDETDSFNCWFIINNDPFFELIRIVMTCSGTICVGAPQVCQWSEIWHPPLWKSTHSASSLTYILSMLIFPLVTIPHLLPPPSCYCSAPSTVPRLLLFPAATIILLLLFSASYFYPGVTFPRLLRIPAVTVPSLSCSCETDPCGSLRRIPLPVQQSMQVNYPYEIDQETD